MTDTRALRALSHPVRLALLEALLSGPLTATQAGESIGETPTTCSFHLRQLARYGFVEETGTGKGRARPWRLTGTGWSTPARPEDPEYTRAAQAFDQVMLERHTTRIRRFLDAAATYPPEWQTAASTTTAIWHLTPAEVTEVSGALQAVLAGFRDRFTDRHDQHDQRPDGSLPVEFTLSAYPVDIPPTSR